MSKSYQRPLLERYRRYRTVSTKLNHKILNAYMTTAIFDSATQTLGLGKNKSLILDSEDELAILMEYGLYEIHQEDSKNIIQRYYENNKGVNRIERELLEAMRKAVTGLFVIKHLLPQQCQLKLQGLDNPARTVVLTDINLSQSAVESYILFRPIELAELTMTTGIAFAFEPEMEKTLLDHWKNCNESERYEKIFRLSKEQGIPTLFG